MELAGSTGKLEDYHGAIESKSTVTLLLTKWTYRTLSTLFTISMNRMCDFFCIIVSLRNALPRPTKVLKHALMMDCYIIRSWMCDDQ